MDKNKIWAEVSNKRFNDGVFRKLTHEALAAFDQFMAIEYVKSSKSSTWCNMVKNAAEHEAFFLKKHIARKLNTLGFETWESNDLFQLAQLNQWIKEPRGYSDSQLKPIDFETDEEASLLKQAYIIENIKIFLHENARRPDKSATKIFQKQIADQLYFKPEKPTLVFNAYMKYFNLTTEQSTQKKHQGMLKLITELVPYSTKEARNMFNWMQIDIVKRINNGENLYESLLNLYKTGLFQGFLTRNKKIEAGEYGNMVLTACRIKEYQWALEFVESYNKLLSEDMRADAYAYNRARIFNNMGEHGKVVESLSQISYTNLTYNLNSRLMLIMAFYELDEYNTLLSTINAFKVFLRRSRKVSVKRKKNFRDFCDATYQLVKAEDKKDVKRLLKAHEIISENPAIPSSWWVKEKITELSQRLSIEDPQKILAKTD